MGHRKYTYVCDRDGLGGELFNGVSASWGKQHEVQSPVQTFSGQPASDDPWVEMTKVSGAGGCGVVLGAPALSANVQS